MDQQKEIVSVMMDMLELMRILALQVGNERSFDPHYAIVSDRLHKLVADVEKQ